MVIGRGMLESDAEEPSGVAYIGVHIPPGNIDSSHALTNRHPNICYSDVASTSHALRHRNISYVQMINA